MQFHDLINQYITDILCKVEWNADRLMIHLTQNKPFNTLEELNVNLWLHVNSWFYTLEKENHIN